MLEFLVDDNLVCKDDRIAVGVSGGADSMLLLWALYFKQKQIGFYLKAIHVNHNLRGSESDADAKFVEDFCKKKKIDYEILNVDVKKYKSAEKKTVEEAARDLRFKAIGDQMKRDKLNKLFLAHHKNDQAETILMHIFRGSGISGAVGICDTETIKRPLLNLTKTEIFKLCQDYGIEYVKDSSNNDNSYTRNFIRNEILPAVEKVYPGAVQSISKFGERCAEVQELIDSQINNDFLVEKNDEVLIKDEVENAQSLVKREYFKRAFEKLGIFADIEEKHFDMLSELFKSTMNTVFDFPHKLKARRVLTGIKLFKENTNELKKVEYSFGIGETEIEGYGKIVVSKLNANEVEYGKGILFADLDKISAKSVWRFREPGDMFSKLGTGSKKLNDYFTDKKIDMDIRDRLPVLANDNQVLVVAENDISEKVKIDGETDTIVKIEFLR
ncbi:MAG: tRNA lysidine(34) synthetase TilS [Clostridia bacterium]|nr:tRNA lysidine(34) synthetase TilS [Clostridia bacterium]